MTDFRMPKKVLSIAGSDPSGGAGIQGDLKTIFANGAYGMAAITTLTAQNTLEVKSIEVASQSMLRSQLEAIFEDERPDALKIGMISSPWQAEIIGDVLSSYKAENIVVDPIISATTGVEFAKENTIKMVMRKIFPIATLITPNIPEAMKILQVHEKFEEGKFAGQLRQGAVTQELLARRLGEIFKCSVLVKGGHRKELENVESKDQFNQFMCADILWSNGQILTLENRWIDNKNNHGTGCALSSAIATGLAKGKTLEESVLYGKNYISHILESPLDFGKGNGPLDHGYGRI